MKCPQCKKQVVLIEKIRKFNGNQIWACPECKQQNEKMKNNTTDSLFYIVIPPHSACEIKWASKENSETLDSKILCGGPVRVAVMAD